MIEEDLVTYLTDHLGVKAIIDGRIDPIQLKQDTELPALTYRNITAMREKSQQGSSGLAHPRIQITCWAEDYPGVKRLAQAVRFALDGFKGTWGTRRIDAVLQQTDLDDFDSTTERHKVLMDFIIWHKEEVA